MMSENFRAAAFSHLGQFTSAVEELLIYSKANPLDYEIHYDLAGLHAMRQKL